MKTTQDITSILHARADKKLNDFIHSRLGDLFELCGGHMRIGEDRPKLEDWPEIKQQLTNCKMPQEFPWKGAVIELCKSVVFAHLRDKWREKECHEFVKKLDEIHSYTYHCDEQ